MISMIIKLTSVLYVVVTNVCRRFIIYIYTIKNDITEKLLS